jgi:hypothetical protein
MLNYSTEFRREQPILAKDRSGKNLGDHKKAHLWTMARNGLLDSRNGAVRILYS